MNPVISRFIRYIKIDTQSARKSISEQLRLLLEMPASRETHHFLSFSFLCVTCVPSQPTNPSAT
ncbi:MAG: hypothetical protein SVP52_00895, partial [Chloroflexota bacterium]|nr:hypothetical protein [Chloroflexota bacterium]